MTENLVETAFPGGALPHSKDVRVSRGGFVYQYKSVSVEHLPELRKTFEQFDQENKLSRHPTYRGYVDELACTVPEGFPDAKFVIIAAYFCKLGLVNFHYQGKVYQVKFPPNYYQNKITREMVRQQLQQSVVRGSDWKVETASGLFLKQLAVRSGLGQYGRNNICYVKGMGSLINLCAFWTNAPDLEDHWGDLKMMKRCKNCHLCTTLCPNQCIGSENFVINVSRCIPLYNEIEGEFPEWMEPKSHNAMMGCMRCQYNCPENREAVRYIEQFEDISEEETQALLSMTADRDMLETLTNKLHYDFLTEPWRDLPVMSRNLKALLV